MLCKLTFYKIYALSNISIITARLVCVQWRKWLMPTWLKRHWKRYIHTLPRLTFLYKHYNSVDTQYIFKLAAHNGNLPILQYLITRHDCDKNYAFQQACKNRHANIIKWLGTPPICNNIDISANRSAAIRYACQYNNVDVIKYLCNHPKFQYKVDEYCIETYIMKYCSANGFLDVIIFLIRRYYDNPVRTREYAAIAKKTRQIRVYNYLQSLCRASNK